MLNNKQNAKIKDVVFINYHGVECALGKIVEHPKGGTWCFEIGQDVTTTRVGMKLYEGDKLVSFETNNTFYEVVQPTL